METSGSTHGNEMTQLAMPVFCLIYAHQTKILEGRTNLSEGVSREALFNVSSPKSSTHTLEKCFPGKRLLKGLSGLPKSSFGSLMGGV
jgi:hypothetical protein